MNDFLPRYTVPGIFGVEYKSKALSSFAGGMIGSYLADEAYKGIFDE